MPRLAIEFHVMLNVVGALVFLPFVGPISALVERFMPGKEEKAEAVTPRYLDRTRSTARPRRAGRCRPCASATASRACCAIP
jgi:Na+/phosphate symporter